MFAISFFQGSVQCGKKRAFVTHRHSQNVANGARPSVIIYYYDKKHFMATRKNAHVNIFTEILVSPGKH